MTGPDEHLPVQDDDRRALEHRPLAELERVQPAAVVYLRARAGGSEAQQRRCACARACVCVRACGCVRVRVCARASVCMCLCMICARIYTVCAGVCADLLAEACAAEARAARHESHRVRVAEPIKSIAASLPGSVRRDPPGAVHSVDDDVNKRAIRNGNRELRAEKK